MLKRYQLTIGILAISLIVLGSCSKIFPKPNPVACFTTLGELATNKPIQFMNCSQMGYSYDWYFQDGYSYTDKNPIHYFKNQGEQLVTLVVTNETGAKSTISERITVLKTPPVKFIINSIVLKEWPLHDYGNPWDPNSGPDMYPKILMNSKISFDPKLYITDCKEYNDYIFSFDQGFPVPIQEFDQDYMIEWYDHDTTSKDELMGKALFQPVFAFTTNDVQYTLKNGDLEFILQVTWLY